MRPDLFLNNDRLREVRQNTDWRKLFAALRIRKDERKSRQHDWWGVSPLNPHERNASFHVNDKGWYCHSTGQGGGPIELVQALHPEMSCYDAGRWLLEHQVSFLVAETRSGVAATTDTAPVSKPVGSSAQLEAQENRPIRQDLRPRLDPGHAAFAARGIPPETLQELGAGHWKRQNTRKDGRPDPLSDRLVFQVRGLSEDERGYLQPVVLTHTGRALTVEQEDRDGKWWTFPGFVKSLELYNLDLAILDEEASLQTNHQEHVIIVEGCFDVAKLWAAGIRNVVATFGARLYRDQLPRIDFLSEMLGIDRFLIWYDRDQDGAAPHGRGAVEAVEMLRRRGYEVDAFDWGQTFQSRTRGQVPIPAEIMDPAEFTVEQLRWLREQGWV